MIYKVIMDGESIYDATDDMTLLSPSLSIEVSSAGSLDFTMPISHSKYGLPQTLISNVEVYENDDLIWYGRVSEIKKNMFNHKEVFCEGAFAFFNDSIQRPKIFDTTTVHEFFRYIINQHNSQVNADRQFTVGQITVDDISIYRKLDYESTMDVLKSMCLDTDGGYLFFRRENGINYIDWLSDMASIGVQPVQFALNLIDISVEMVASDIKTVILPLGAEVDGERITITDINGGLDFLESPYADQYGRITEVVEFNNIFTAEELKLAAEKWLLNMDYSPETITCDAAELSYIDPSYPAFKVGQKVKVTSPQHSINKVYPLTSIDISLDSAVKQITLGTPEKRELTQIYKSDR